MIVVFPHRDRVWVVQTKFGLQYLHRPAIERLGLDILALGPKQAGEVVVAVCNGGMILTKSLFIDLEGPPIERLGLVMLALVLKQIGEVVVIPRNVGVILTENLF